MKTHRWSWWQPILPIFFLELFYVFLSFVFLSFLFLSFILLSFIFFVVVLCFVLCFSLKAFNYISILIKVNWFHNWIFFIWKIVRIVRVYKLNHLESLLIFVWSFSYYVSLNLNTSSVLYESFFKFTLFTQHISNIKVRGCTFKWRVSKNFLFNLKTLYELSNSCILITQL